MGSNNLFDPMSDKLIKPGCPTRDRTQLSNPMSDKPIKPGFLLTHFARNEIGSNAAIGAPLLCPCTDTETEDGPGAELSPTPGRSYVAPSRPVAALGRYQAACARSSSGSACDDSGYRRITVAHPFRPGDPWRRRGGMGTGSGTVSQVAPLVRFTQSCDQAGTAASSGRALS
ncbi:hypothetical protein PCASD_14513 [Puccinia coronata f. sp. avenae]|uniref:Uncharacterized protein n=1 Tax=Puccinia coronata f. sp. avenae TaxID=200324 RepID=A0A2N5TEY9_9BASI|nr:hypothetical protein PCASD_14513 [Puccinia coronata f. sp. avenae]